MISKSFKGVFKDGYTAATERADILLKALKFYEDENIYREHEVGWVGVFMSIFSLKDQGRKAKAAIKEWEGTD